MKAGGTLCRIKLLDQRHLNRVQPLKPISLFLIIHGTLLWKADSSEVSNRPSEESYLIIVTGSACDEI